MNQISRYITPYNDVDQHFNDVFFHDSNNDTETI